MSTVEKMSIHGIRSFGPEDTDKQVINFFSPLTLILGPNGTGKTTIIECLKYMTTGVLPPGSKGGAFIHDPKVAHEREVKGQVRLQFKDVSGESCIVQRSMVATQKMKKIEMRTLDGVITRRDKRTGEKKSITSRCAEIDREMITSLGVSKPVLENVIFCHQEDSNWPLIEGKSLKEKFDAIFASTRYVKALETIRKLKQEQDQGMKLCKQEISFLKQHKDKASELEGDMSEVQAKLVASKESVRMIREKLQPIEEKLDQISANSNEIYKVQNDITKLTSEKKQLEKTAAEIEENIENEFSGTTEELKRALKEFQEKLQEKEETLEQFEKRAGDVTKETERHGREKSVVLVAVGKMEQEAENQEENVRKRDSSIRKIATEYGFEGFSRGPITEEKCLDFIENIKHKLEELVKEGREIKAKFEEDESDLQKKIDEKRDKKSKLEQNEHIKKNTVKENNSKIRQINHKLSEVEASASRLDQLTRELKRMERELQNVEQSVNVEDVKKEIASMIKEKANMDGSINELSTEIDRLHLESSAQAQLDLLKKDKSSKEENIRRLRAKHEDTITYLLGHMPSRNIRGEMDDYTGKQTDMVRKCNIQLQKARNELTMKEAEKKMVSEQIRKKEEELKGLQDKIYNVCGSERFEEGLTTIQQKMNQSQDQRGSLLGAEHFFKKYVEDLEKRDPCCPLCHREFDTDQEVRELVLELRNKLRLVPSKLEKAESDLDNFQKKYDSLLQLRPLQENITGLDQSEIPELKRKLKRLTEEVDKLNTTVQDIEDEMSTKEGDESMAKEMQADIVLMDRYFGDVRELEKKIATQSALLSGGDSSRTLQDVISEKEEFQLQLDTVTQRLERKRQKLSDHSDQVQRLRGSINTLKEEKLKIDSDLQQRYKLEEDKAMLLSENEMHEKDILGTAEELRPLEAQIGNLRREKEELVKRKEEQVEQVKSELDSVKNNGNKVKNVDKEIKVYMESGKEKQLEKKKKQLQSIQNKIDECEEEQKDLATNIDKLRNALATTQARQRELADNLQLRKKVQEIKNMSSEVAELQKQLGGFDIQNLERERRKLQQNQEKLKTDQNIADGRQRGYEEQITSIKKELSSDMYKGAGDKYRAQVITFRTTELANSDLEKYYRALDKAIMNYHTRKMEEINKIICELWKNTYRGNDIETIEIRSDDDEGGIMKTRRNYNYRVVMMKGDAALDMRGRCSAGQKVLASLIIRLALAETFCLNCGILALDEPTTNLDRENIESLAYALVEIIKSRSVQRNFQLVVITHDEDFVELLGRSEYVDRFFKVMKNPAGCSRLVEASVQTLHTH